MKKCRSLVIGSNSYLGINLCRNLNHEDTLLVSKSTSDQLNSGYDFLQCDFVNKVLPEIHTTKVYILSRPVTDSKEELGRFYSGLSDSLASLLAANPELQVHFVSTSLVFASDSPEPLNATSPTDLRISYERYKYEFEQWLEEKSLEYPAAIFNVYRIPLLVGGLLRESDKKAQLFYRMYSDFRNGNRWVFQSGAPEFGTSFLDVTDFVNWITNENFANGYTIYLPASGSITYKELQSNFEKRSFPLPIKTTKSCPSSFLYIENNTPLKQRNFQDIFNP